MCELFKVTQLWRIIHAKHIDNEIARHIFEKLKVVSKLENIYVIVSLQTSYSYQKPHARANALEKPPSLLQWCYKLFNRNARIRSQDAGSRDKLSIA